MKELIERLEKAIGPDRELDAEIAVATYTTTSIDEDLIYAKLAHKDDDCAAGCYWEKSRSGASLRRADLYTSSFDAAYTLIDLFPENGWWLYRVNQYHTGQWPAGWWGVHLRHTPPWDRGEIVGESKASLPVALCIAALKARSQP